MRYRIMVMFWAGLLVFAGLGTLPAQASLVDDTVGGCVNTFVSTSCVSISTLFTSDTAVVGGGVEFTTLSFPSGGKFFADFTGSQITISIANQSSGNQFFSDLTWGFNSLDWLPVAGVITNVQPVSGGTLPINSLTSTPNTITFNTPDGLFVAPNTTLSTTLNIEADHTPAAVPIPSTMLLMVTGLVGLAAWRWWSTKIA